jgi:hypothetical protein
MMLSRTLPAVGAEIVIAGGLLAIALERSLLKWR